MSDRSAHTERITWSERSGYRHRRGKAQHTLHRVDMPKVSCAVMDRTPRDNAAQETDSTLKRPSADDPRAGWKGYMYARFLVLAPREKGARGSGGEWSGRVRHGHAAWARKRLACCKIAPLARNRHGRLQSEHSFERPTHRPALPQTPDGARWRAAGGTRRCASHRMGARIMWSVGYRSLCRCRCHVDRAGKTGGTRV